MSLNAIATPAVREPGPLVIGCRSLTVAKVDSYGIGSSQVDPVLGGVVVERQQHVDVLGDLGERGFGAWVRRLRKTKSSHSGRSRVADSLRNELAHDH